jgi:DNA-binding CsgD family transcriptional regulator
MSRGRGTLPDVAVDRKGLSPVMVGRGAALGQLLGLLPSRLPVDGSGPEVALIGGEAGIGKSRMVIELLAAIPQGTRVLVGRAGQGAPGRPYSVLLDAIEPVVAAWTSVPAPLSLREDSVRLVLRPVAPGLAPCNDREYGPDELMRTAVDLVRFLAPAPSVIVFEDLHGADPESVGLFGRLAVMPDLGTLLVGTYRPEDLRRGHPLAALVADLERRRSITHLSLDRLPRASVGELLSAVYGKPVSWHVADMVQRRTGGNPFFIEELLLAAGEPDPERLANMPLPWNLSEVVLRHLDDLTAEERQVIDAAAVLGSRFPFDVLSAVVGIDEEELIPILRRLVAVALLIEDEPDVFSFRHALTREAIAGQLLGRERRRLHERALAVLCQLDSDDFAAMAHHAQGAGRFDQVVDFARRGAAKYLRQGLTQHALGLAEQGLEEDGNDLQLQSLASRAAWTVGLLQLSRRHSLEWRRLAAAAGDRPSEAAAIRHLARLEWEMGDSAGQRAYAAEALALAEENGRSEELALAMALMSEVHMLACDGPVPGQESEEAILWADRALELADELGCPEVRPRALVSKGSALVDLPGRFDEGAAILEQARQEAEEIGDSWNQVRALNNMLGPGNRLWPLERIQAALDEIRRVAAHTGREGQTMAMWAGLAADLSIMKGDMEAARAHLITIGVDEGKERWWRLVNQLTIEIEAGEFGPAASRLPVDPEAINDYALWMATEAHAAELLALEGEPAEAGQRLLHAAGPGGGRSDHAREPVLIAATTLVRHGTDPRLVQSTVRQLDEAWPPWPGEPPSMHQHVEGALLEAEGDPVGALPCYRAALAEPIGYRPAFMVADAEQGVARCLLATGQLEEARQHAERAIGVLARWPGWRAEQAAALLRRVTQSPIAAEGALTTREREVAGLLAEGLTNGQIAQRLYISAKTASVHVSNILAKLGMSSRAEVAAWATREGLAQQPA